MFSVRSYLVDASLSTLILTVISARHRFRGTTITYTSIVLYCTYSSTPDHITLCVTIAYLECDAPVVHSYARRSKSLSPHLDYSHAS